MTKRHRRDDKLEEVAKEHVRHLSGETAAGRTDPAGRRARQETSEKPEGEATGDRAAAEDTGEDRGSEHRRRS